MSDFSLEEAAKHIGMPPVVLHRLTWARFGPKSNGSYWHPRFTIADLDTWLKAEGSRHGMTRPERGPIVAVGTKRVYRARQVQT